MAWKSVVPAEIHSRICLARNAFSPHEPNSRDNTSSLNAYTDSRDASSFSPSHRFETAARPDAPRDPKSRAPAAHLDARTPHRPPDDITLSPLPPWTTITIHAHRRTAIAPLLLRIPPGSV
mmetsp:Transcript_1844/g.5593  ORF Transcript_1844/g.5593 Transcript_1844/m.5593 type:complete len:121 (-) Transcript_1844:2-364(-)